MLLDRGESTRDFYAFRRAGDQYVRVPRNRGLVVESMVALLCATVEPPKQAKMVRSMPGAAPAIVDVPSSRDVDVRRQSSWIFWSISMFCLRMLSEP